MNTNLTIMTRAFAALAGICFIGGVIILSGEGSVEHGQA